MKFTKFKKNKGFTLVELMVSVSVFVVVMVISSGSIMSVFQANKKSQTLRTVMDNLNFTLETVTRTIRFGNKYHCDATQGDDTLPRDCAGGSNSLAIKDAGGNLVIYKLNNGRVSRSINGGLDDFITSSDMTIQDLSFRVFGSSPYSAGLDLYQPQVIIVIRGFAGNQSNSQSSFSLETTVSQMMFDSQ